MKLRLNQFCIVLFIFLPFSCFSQDLSKTEISTFTHISFLNPGISYERKTGKLQSLYLGGFINMHLSLAYSNSVGFNNNLSIDPSATIQYRFYYNALHRKFKGKTTELNNLNYMAVIFKTDLSTRQILFSNRQEYLMDFVTDNKRRLVNQAGIVIGMQRNYKGHLSLDLNIGPAYLFTKQAINMAGQPTTVNVSGITFMGQLTLGFWLNRKS